MRRLLAIVVAVAAFAGTAAAQSVHQVAVGPLHVPRLADGGPVRITVTVTNLGQVREDYHAPSSSLTATVPGHATIVFPDFSVAPGRSQTLTAEWQAPPLVCFCSVRVETTNRHGQPIALSQSVIVFPLRLAGGALVALIGLAVLLWLARTRRRETPAPADEPEPQLDERELAARTAPPPVERSEPEADQEPQPEPQPVPGLTAAAPEPAPARVPEAVRDLPRADELPEWFVRLRTGAPLEPGKRRRR